MRIWTVALGVALLASSAGPGWAQDDGFNEAVQKAMTAYRNKQYAEAIVEFERAYEIRQQPELVYNIARAHEKSLRTEEAIEAYERFLSLSGTTADLRAKALQALGALKREQAAKRAAEAPPPSTTDVGFVPPPVDSTPAGPPVTVRTKKKEPNRALEYALIGTGAAAVVVGAVFGVLALQANSNFEDEKEGTMDPGRLQSLKDDVDRNAAVADVAFIGGAVLGAVGAVLLLTTGNDDEETVAISGGVTPDGGILTLGGRF